MEALTLVNQLEQTRIFKEWLTTHQQHLLAHLFFETDNTQVGYGDLSTQTITTFILGDPIKIIPDQEVIATEHGIEALDLSSVQLSSADAEEKAQEVIQEKYNNETITRTFVILQQLQGTPLYNITFFTKSFKTILVHVSAQDGSIMHESLASLAEMMKGG